MRFAEDRPQEPGHRDPQQLGFVLLFACALTAATTAAPWLRIEWLDLSGEAGWRTQAGFSCLLTSVLLALLYVVESGTRSAPEAVRPASAFVALVTAAILAGDIVDGPGTLRGVAATWTPWFWAAVLGVVAVAATCWRRLPRRRYNSSGPPR